MRDMYDLMNIFTDRAVRAVEAKKLCEIVYGTVISISPLQIQVDQKTILKPYQIKLTRAVMDYETEITINGVRETCTIHNGLKTGDKVTMIRVQGGQQFVVIDKEAAR